MKPNDPCCRPPCIRWNRWSKRLLHRCLATIRPCRQDELLVRRDISCFDQPVMIRAEEDASKLPQAEEAQGSSYRLSVLLYLHANRSLTSPILVFQTPVVPLRSSLSSAHAPDLSPRSF